MPTALDAYFYQSSHGVEPVRNWLHALEEPFRFIRLHATRSPDGAQQNPGPSTPDSGVTRLHPGYAVVVSICIKNVLARKVIGEDIREVHHDKT